MIKVNKQLDSGNFTVLILNCAPPNKWNNTVRIDGIIYETEIVYDLPNAIGIKGKGDFLNKNVDFI